MIKNEYFEQYKNAIADGTYRVCKEQVLLVEYLENVILKRDDIFFDRDKTDKYIRFAEKNFFPLALYQKFISSFIFMYWKETDRVVFREFLITLGRGGGKNGWMSTLGAFFISPLHGIPGYNATITANSEDQAKTSFEEVYTAILTKGLETQYEVKKTEITGKATNSRFKYRTNNPKTMDSARDGCLFFDEIHQFEDNKPVKVQRSGLGKVKHPRTFYFGTNGYVREGFYDKQTSEVLQKANKSISAAYQLKTGLSQEDLLNLMDNETWLTAEEAKTYGFVDEILFQDEAVTKLTANFKDMLPANIVAKMQNMKPSFNSKPELELSLIIDRVAEKVLIRLEDKKKDAVKPQNSSPFTKYLF